jgi:hypothetical protein
VLRPENLFDRFDKRNAIDDVDKQFQEVVCCMSKTEQRRIRVSGVDNSYKGFCCQKAK